MLSVRTRWRRDARRSTFLSACLGVTGRQSGFPLSIRTDFFTFYSSLDHGFHFIRRGNGEPWSFETFAHHASGPASSNSVRCCSQRNPENVSFHSRLNCLLLIITYQPTVSCTHFKKKKEVQWCCQVSRHLMLKLRKMLNIMIQKILVSRLPGLSIYFIYLAAWSEYKFILPLFV